MPFVENLDEFLARHGRSTAITMVEGFPPSTMLLECGAVVHRDGRPMDSPLMLDPPEDQTQLLKVRVRYWETRTKQAEESFELLKRIYLGLIYVGEDNRTVAWKHYWGPQPETGDRVVLLKRLREVVLSERKSLAAVKKELAKQPEVVAAERARELRRKQIEEQAEHERAIRQELDSINI